MSWLALLLWRVVPGGAVQLDHFQIWSVLAGAHC